MLMNLLNDFDILEDEKIGRYEQEFAAKFWDKNKRNLILGRG